MNAHAVPPSDEGLCSGWKLDKTIPITLIFILAMQLLAGVAIVADLKKDVEILKAQVVIQHERDQRQDVITTESDVMLRAQLDRIDSKLDRMFERMPRK